MTVLLFGRHRTLVFLVLFDSTPESKNNMPLNPLQFKDGFDFLKKVLK
jgi:hypothetical protein